MNRNYLRDSPVKVARLARIIAKMIDLAIVAILALLFYPLGIFLAVIYIGISDSIQNGQSIGKRFMGIAVISLEDGSPCSVKQSFIRNLPIILPLILAVIPLWGWIIGFILGLATGSLELYFLMKLESTHRLGDVMADTTVFPNDGTHSKVKQANPSWFEGTGASGGPRP